jgi:hypothetical protein
MIIQTAIAAAQRIQDQHPSFNWWIILGSAAASWLAPIASLVAIFWGVLQIYLAVEKRWFRKGDKP